MRSEGDLRDAQEYYFRTHATNSRLIAQGRKLQGFRKLYSRRKLRREIGEDYRLYTGQELGETPEGEEPRGIRGDLNQLLETVYRRIAPGTPITSPFQEDLTILSHPAGALEVVYAIVFYYMSLQKKYVTLASNRRKVLKSLLDEEVFKWIWRLTLNYLLSDDNAKGALQDFYLTMGVSYIPAELQRAKLPQKLVEIGKFLLGRTMAESHLRFSLCYYFVAYLRAIQGFVLTQPALATPETIYTQITRHKEGEPYEHVLVAIDALMNMSGSSMQSFDDVLQEQQRDLDNFIPVNEVDFIRQFDPFADPENLRSALRRLVPASTKTEVVDNSASAVPIRLLLVLRTVTPAVRRSLVENIPLALLVMLRNRIVNGQVDDAARLLDTQIKSVLERRGRKGDFVLPVANRAGVITVGPAKATDAAQKPVPAAKAAPGAAAQAHPHAAAAAADAQAAPAAAQAAPPAGPTVGPMGTGPLEQRLIFAWRQRGQRLVLSSLSARELIALVGNDPRYFIPWVVAALQTGQIFGLPLDALSQDLVAKLVKALLGKVPPGRPGRLPQDVLTAVVEDSQDASPATLLGTLFDRARLQDSTRPPDVLDTALVSLTDKFATDLPEFLRNPSREEFRDLRKSLAPQERQLVAILQRVARLQAVP